jgi:hypothetical protein
VSLRAYGSLLKRWVERANLATLHIGRGLMSHWKSFGLAIFAVVYLLGATCLAYAGCNPGADCAVEWSHGSATDLGNLPGSIASEALRINDAGQAVGVSVSGSLLYATEWSHGKVINLGGLPGYMTSAAFDINDAGHAVGYSEVGGVDYAVEWNHGKVINLSGLPGSTGSYAYGINNAGQVAGYSEVSGIWSAASGTSLSGAAAKSLTSEACQALPLALPAPLTMPGRWWDTARSAASIMPPSGAAAAPSTCAACQAP